MPMPFGPTPFMIALFIQTSSVAGSNEVTCLSSSQFLAYLQVFWLRSPLRHILGDRGSTRTLLSMAMWVSL